MIMIYNQKIMPENTKANHTGSIFHHHFIRSNFRMARDSPRNLTISTENCEPIIIFGFVWSVDEIIIE